MNAIRGLILAALMLPVLELAVFVIVAAVIGFGWALALIVLLSASGIMVLRHAGGTHIARIKVALGDNRLSALQADGAGALILIAGILLAIPGFITGLLGLLLLIAPLRRAIGAALGRMAGAAPRPADGIVDLAPGDWRAIPDPQLPDRDRNNDGGR